MWDHIILVNSGGVPSGSSPCTRQSLQFNTRRENGQNENCVSSPRPPNALQYDRRLQYASGVETPDRQARSPAGDWTRQHDRQRKNCFGNSAGNASWLSEPNSASVLFLSFNPVNASPRTARKMVRLNWPLAPFPNFLSATGFRSAFSAHRFEISSCTAIMECRPDGIQAAEFFARAFMIRDSVLDIRAAAGSTAPPWEL